MPKPLPHCVWIKSTTDITLWELQLEGAQGHISIRIEGQDLVSEDDFRLVLDYLGFKARNGSDQWANNERTKFFQSRRPQIATEANRCTEIFPISRIDVLGSAPPRKAILLSQLSQILLRLPEDNEPPENYLD